MRGVFCAMQQLTAQLACKSGHGALQLLEGKHSVIGCGEVVRVDWGIGRMAGRRRGRSRVVVDVICLVKRERSAM